MGIAVDVARVTGPERGPTQSDARATNELADRHGGICVAIGRALLGAYGHRRDREHCDRAQDRLQQLHRDTLGVGLRSLQAELSLPSVGGRQVMQHVCKSLHVCSTSWLLPCLTI